VTNPNPADLKYKILIRRIQILAGSITSLSHKLFSTPHVFDAPLHGWLHRNYFNMIVGICKLESLGYCVALFTWSYF